MKEIDSNYVIKLDGEYYDTNYGLFFLIAPFYKNGDLLQFMKEHPQMS